MKKGQFNPPKGKKLLPEQKIHSSYGKIKYNSYGTQSHDGLVIPQVKRHMKILNPKLKQSDIFDETGDGKPSKKDPENKAEVKPLVKQQRAKPYSYKKRI
tara:strand:- start:623 stop:922 length:300 start_codon:yes stop_codon:yes gene_type:complete